MPGKKGGGLGMGSQGRWGGPKSRCGCFAGPTRPCAPEMERLFHTSL